MRTKCDRCGYVFSGIEEVNFSDNYWRLSVHYDNHPYPETKIDLCPYCQKELVKWLNMDEKM